MPLQAPKGSGYFQCREDAQCIIKGSIGAIVPIPVSTYEYFLNGFLFARDFAHNVSTSQSPAMLFCKSTWMRTVLSSI